MLLMGAEITDKVFDALTTVEYHNKKLFRNPKQSVHDALLAFMIIGLLVFIPRMYLYIWKMCCFEKDDEEDHDKWSICVSAIKLIIEVFPQSVIAKFFFDGCPIKESDWKFLDLGFDIFCIIPYVLFIYSLSKWYCCGNGTEQGKWMSCFIMFATVISSVGFGFAIVSVVESRTNCP